MSSPKGFSDQKKSGTSQHVTVNPVLTEVYGLDVSAHGFLKEVATDAVEAASTTTSIVATAHLARVGDVIRFTSGTHDKRDVVVTSVETNAIGLGEVLPSAPAAAVTFRILRHSKPVLDADGAIATTATIDSSGLALNTGPTQFVLDGVDTEVEEVSGTPANSRPLPVKLLTAAGAVMGAAATPIRTDPTGTTTQPVSAASLPLPSGASTSAKQDTANTSLASIDGKITAVNTGAVVVSSSALPSGASTSAKQDTGNTSLAAIDTSNSAIKTSVEIMDDWDESDRCKVNPIAGQAGVAGNTGAVSATTQRVTLATDVLLPAAKGRSKVELLTNNHASVSITTSAYVQLVASTSAEINCLDIFDSSGSMFVLAVGAAASEVDKLYIFPGGNGRVELNIPASSRISVKAVDTATSVGRLLINCLS